MILTGTPLSVGYASWAWRGASERKLAGAGLVISSIEAIALGALLISQFT
jgi:hypothetical protein